jgi:ppGpp synthetase/RelA/SpoT-type nucleotidyltranferase
MSKAEELVAEFVHHRPALEALAARLVRDLEAELARAGVAVQFVSSRVKAPDSLRHKLGRPDKTYRRLWDVTDLVGLRVATYFEDAIDDVARLVERRHAVDFAHSTDKLRFTDHGKFGYRSLHYVCALPGGEAPDAAFRFEIQVRTVLQHAWAEVEHDLGYKATAVPEQIRRRFSRIASLLEIADQEFVSIRRELRRYEEAARAEAAHPDRPLSLDVISLATLCESEAVAALDAAVAAALGKRVTDEPFFPEYVVKMLRLAGLGTTTEVRDAIARHGAEVPRVVAPYAEFARGAWQLDLSAMEGVARGYGLVFLAHVAILRGPDLGLSKVAKLTRLYQELDEPNDERAAHRVATGLVKALGI